MQAQTDAYLRQVSRVIITAVANAEADMHTTSRLLARASGLLRALNEAYEDREADAVLGNVYYSAVEEIGEAEPEPQP